MLPWRYRNLRFGRLSHILPALQDSGERKALMSQTSDATLGPDRSRHERSCCANPNLPMFSFVSIDANTVGLNARTCADARSAGSKLQCTVDRLTSYSCLLPGHQRQHQVLWFARMASRDLCSTQRCASRSMKKDQ